MRIATIVQLTSGALAAHSLRWWSAPRKMNQLSKQDLCFLVLQVSYCLQSLTSTWERTKLLWKKLTSWSWLSTLLDLKTCLTPVSFPHPKHKDIMILLLAHFQTINKKLTSLIRFHTAQNSLHKFLDKCLNTIQGSDQPPKSFWNTHTSTTSATRIKSKMLLSTSIRKCTLKALLITSAKSTQIE